MKQFLTLLLVSASFFFCVPSTAQQTKLDSLFAGADTTAVMDSLLAGFDAYLDSISQPKNFFSVSLGVGTGLFSFKNSSSFDYTTQKKLMVSPELSYFHKSGLALSLTGYLLKTGESLSSYQYAISPSYQFLKSKTISTGVSYTHYITSKNVNFYTTPIQNEMYAYFFVKKWWLEPGISASYGWGNTTRYEENEIEVARKKKTNAKSIIYVQTDQSVKDLSLLFSLRHKFIWEKVFREQDMFTLTPALLLSGGTQNFGFNTSFSSNSKYITNNFLPTNINITDSQGMQFQSTTFALQMNYSTGKFYVLPQVLLDYYLHDIPQRFNTVYSLTVGHNF